MIKVTPVVLSGGSGTRLWPLSRTEFPKQFLNLSPEQPTLYQQTLQRLDGIQGKGIEKNNTLIVTVESHRFLAASQWDDKTHGASTIILEPAGRNTAPALTLAALQETEYGHDSVLVVSPADHLVTAHDGASATIQDAIFAANTGTVVIFGVEPQYPESNYGYIETKKQEGEKFLKVIKFIEKPSTLIASKYMANGGYYWNAGVLIIKASEWLRLIRINEPSIYEDTLRSWKNRIIDNQFIRPHKEYFEKIESKSIDYAVLERLNSKNMDIRLLKYPGDWSDLGNWDAVADTLHRDSNENSYVGDVISIDSKKNILYSTNRLLATIGIEDIMVIDTPDALLVSKRGESAGIKKLANILQSKERKEGRQHKKVTRPWGWYDEIDSGPYFKVKRIVVNVGASLSLQSHKHRSEHWVVVAGTARVINGEYDMVLNENQSTYIPKTVIHRLSNIGKFKLEIIEVQTGETLEEDITRYSDDYGRN